jgi:ankyrin repeat protein
MKYLRLFEDFDPYDPYELMMIPPNKKAEMIIGEIYKDEPNLNLVSDLITLGANLEWQDEDGWTPLHWAAYYGNVEIARMLIGAKVDLNLQDRWGWTPLHRAAFYGYVEIARMLIDAGASKDILNNDGELPYDLAETEELKKLLKP